MKLKLLPAACLVLFGIASQTQAIVVVHNNEAEKRRDAESRTQPIPVYNDGYFIVPSENFAVRKGKFFFCPTGYKLKRGQWACVYDGFFNHGEPIEPMTAQEFVNNKAGGDDIAMVVGIAPQYNDAVIYYRFLIDSNHLDIKWE